jgi:YbbR domain-containing protein
MSKKTPRIKISENVNLLLASFALAFLTWVFAKAGEVEEANLPVPVTAGEVEKDPRYDVKIEPPTMLVRLRYGKDSASYINSENFRLVVDTGDLRQNLAVDWKTKSLPLTANNLVANIPRKVEVLKIGTTSSNVDVKMKWHAYPAVVEPDIVNEDRLPEGYQLVTPTRVSPSEIWIAGDPDVIRAMPRDEMTSRIRVATEKINVAEHKQSSLENVPIKLPPGVEIIQRQSTMAEVNVEVQEVQTVREVRGVKLDFQAVAADSVKLQYAEKSASVTVFGPQSLLKQVTPDSFKISLIRPAEELPGTTRDLPIEAHFAANVPEDLRSRVTIRSVDPKIIRVKYLDAHPAGAVLTTQTRSAASETTR